MCHLITFLVLPSLVSLRKTQSLVTLHTASDFFVRDVKAMAREAGVWKVTTSHELIWHKNDGDVGWSFTDNRLERKEGIYEGTWKHAKTSIIAKGLVNAVFTPHQHGDQIVGIELVMISQHAPEKPVVCFVCSQNREKA